MAVPERSHSIEERGRERETGIAISIPQTTYLSRRSTYEKKKKNTSRKKEKCENLRNRENT